MLTRFLFLYYLLFTPVFYTCFSSSKLILHDEIYKKGGEHMIKNKYRTITAKLMFGAIMPVFFAVALNATSLLNPVSSLVSTATGLVQSVVSNGNASATVSNQTGVNVLGNTVQTSTGATTQLGL